MSFFNGHTGQMDKQHTYIKHFTPGFLKWTHGKNGQTTYSLKGLYPCLFLMDTQDKRTNNILIQSILHRCFYNGHTGKTDKQHDITRRHNMITRHAYDLMYSIDHVACNVNNHSALTGDKQP